MRSFPQVLISSIWAFRHRSKTLWSYPYLDKRLPNPYQMEHQPHQNKRSVTVPIYTTITYFITWILDDKNGDIAQQYLINANIPHASYRFVDPALLTCCHDLYVMPHADPTWATHKNLLSWNTDFAGGVCDGGIWAACHADGSPVLVRALFLKPLLLQLLHTRLCFGQNNL
jgi:hypothetical protein